MFVVAWDSGENEQTNKQRRSERRKRNRRRKKQFLLAKNYRLK